MRTDPKKSFFRDLKKITSPSLKEEIENAIDMVKAAKTIKNIHCLKKLKGYRNQYRIRVGEYRIGITIEGDMVAFVRCLLRKDFYKVFP